MEEKISGKEFESYFHTFKHSWFRLQTLQKYTVEDEVEELNAYFSGEIMEEPMNDLWFENLKNKIIEGKKLKNIHIISLPLSSYLRACIDTWYVYRARKGEDIRFVLPNVPKEILDRLNFDFWLFDDTTTFRIDYDAEGRPIEVVKLTDPEQIENCIKLKELAIKHSVSFREFLRLIRNNLINAY